MSISGSPGLPRLKVKVSVRDDVDTAPSDQSFVSLNSEKVSSSEIQSAGGEPAFGARKRNRTVLIVLAVLLGVVLLVVVPTVVAVCVLTGNDSSEGGDDDVLTLLVAYQDPSIDALSFLPAVLLPFIDKVSINSSGLQILTFANPEILNTARNILSTHPELEFLVKDFQVHVPTDPKVIPPLVRPVRRSLQDAAQPVVDDPLFPQQWYITKTGADRTWTDTTGARQLVLAIVDTGVDLKHKDLINQLWVNTGEIPGNGIDDDGNGFIDDVHGYDFNGVCASMNGPTCTKCQGGPDPQDTEGHGTGVAGIIVAQQNNLIGISGIAPNIKIMVLKVSDCFTDAMYISSVSRAFDYAERMGADLVSCSFGDRYSNYFWPVAPAPSFQQNFVKPYLKALQPLAAKKIPVVAAAGNEFLNLDQLFLMKYPYSPCLLSVQMPNIICVSGTDKNDSRPAFANYGTIAVQLAAPAVDLVTTALGGGYANVSGTSESAPMVSAAMALVMSVLGRTTGDYIKMAPAARQILLSTVDVISNLPVNTSGRLNVQAAVAKAAAVAGANSGQLQPSGFSPQQASLVTAGFVETYYDSPNNNWNPSDLAVLSQTIRAGVPSFSSFQSWPGPALLVYSSNVWFDEGPHQVQISANQNVQVQLLIGSTNFSSAVGPVASFYASKAGWYSFELRLQNPAPSSRVSVYLRPPEGSSLDLPSPASFLVSAGPTPPGSAAISRIATDLAEGFLVSFNVSSNPVLSSGATFPGKSGGYSYSTAISDLQYMKASDFIASLLAAVPTSEANGVLSAVGTMSAQLTPPTAPFNTTLRITCQRCILYLNGLPVASNWNLKPGTQQTTCINLKQAGPYEISIAFAVNLTTPNTASSSQAMPWVLSWAPCSGWDNTVGASSAAAVPAVTYKSLAGSGLLGTSLFWQPANSSAGSVTGVQCDVWVGTASVPDASQAPTHTVRLPGCAAGASSASGTPCQWSFTLQDLLPSISSTAVSAMRCWTYWSGNTKGGVLGASAAGAAAAPLVFLADKQISLGAPAAAARPQPQLEARRLSPPPPRKLGANGNKAPNTNRKPTPDNSVNVAAAPALPLVAMTNYTFAASPVVSVPVAPLFSTPNSTYYRILAVHYQSVVSSTRLTLEDGTTPLAIDALTMLLPVVATT